MTDRPLEPAPGDVTRRGLLGAAAGAGGVLALAGEAGASATTATTFALPPGSRLDLEIRFRHETRGARGRERVGYAFNLDGTITMTATSESFDPPVVRDVIYLLGPDFRPRSCHVHVVDAGRHAATGWFRLSNDVAELEGESQAQGRISRRYPLDEPVRALVAHPVSSDVHVGMAADKSRPGEVLEARGVYLTSADPYGRTGPEFVPADVAIAYLGPDLVETPIGRLRADHYLLHLPAANGGYEPFQDLWCAAGTPVFLQAHARPPIATRYELTGLTVTPPR